MGRTRSPAAPVAGGCVEPASAAAPAPGAPAVGAGDPLGGTAGAEVAGAWPAEEAVGVAEGACGAGGAEGLSWAGAGAVVAARAAAATARWQPRVCPSTSPPRGSRCPRNRCRRRRLHRAPSTRPPPRPRMRRPWPPRRQPSASPATPCWRDPAPLRSRVRASCSSTYRFYELGIDLHRATQCPRETAASCGELDAVSRRASREWRRGRDRLHGRASWRLGRAPRAWRARRLSPAGARSVRARRSSSDFGATRPHPTQRRWGVHGPKGWSRPYGVCSSMVSCAADTSAGRCSESVESPAPGRHVGALLRRRCLDRIVEMPSGSLLLALARGDLRLHCCRRLSSCSGDSPPAAGVRSEIWSPSMFASA